MMEIPTGKLCYDENNVDCPFYSDLDGGGQWCSVFSKDIGIGRCLTCLSAYPNGATIEIKPKEASCK